MRRNSDLMRYFMEQKSTLAPRLTWRATNAEQHQAWRKRFARRLRLLVGHEPAPVPLKVDWAETTETEAFTRHKIYVQSEEHYWIPAYYYVPKRRVGPVPSIVCLHGHSGIYPYVREGDEHQREKCRKSALDFAPFFAEHGYVTIAPVQRGWNETAEGVDRNESGCQRMALNSFLVGMSPVGLRCWDASRLIDFLQTQECVDSTQVGVAGLSGGGMVALFWAALERRVTFAMVAGYYCSFQQSIYSIRHCLCNCVPNMMEWGDMREVAALIAPRPLLVISGKKDPLFPIAATRQAFAELEKVYALIGASQHLEKDFFDGPHAWSNRKTLAFIGKHVSTLKQLPNKGTKGTAKAAPLMPRVRRKKSGLTRV